VAPPIAGYLTCSVGEDRAAARRDAAAVSDEMIDSIALAGTPEEVRVRFGERWDGVYERTLLWPPAFRGEEGVRAAVEAFRPGA
jgi:alkanesulfonate monooxygenase SsuD/methylene tetrahydromethanopterin reductase-like flavin-dependent oxidoreductase (luciferase family)